MKIYDSLIIDIDIYNVNDNLIEKLIKKASENHATILIIGQDLENTVLNIDGYYSFSKKMNDLYFNENIISSLKYENLEHLLTEYFDFFKSLRLIQIISKSNIIIDEIDFIPCCTIKKNESFPEKLAEIIERKNKIINIMSHSKVIKKEKLLSKEGGVYFSDYEVIEIYKKNPDNLLFSLFQVSIYHNKNKYILNTDEGIILRGPHNYYFPLCYYDNEYASIEMPVIFLKNFKNISPVFKLNSSVDLRIYLSILDILKNLLTIILYNKSYETEKKLIIYDNEATELNRIYLTLKKTLKTSVELIISDDYISTEDNRLSSVLMSIVQETIDICESIKINQSYKELSFRNWRETDNLVENINNIYMSLKSKTDLSDIDNIILWGINYGSIDLAILTEILYEKLFDKNCFSGLILTKSSYYSLYNCSLIKKYESHTIKQHYNDCSIIIDDNILSGNSLKAALLELTKYFSPPKHAIIMRYPPIGRIKQMQGLNKGIYPNLLLLNNYILGMHYPTHFTKLCNERSLESAFDSLNVFDQTKRSIIELLFKNELYHTNSVVIKNMLNYIGGIKYGSDSNN